MPEAPQLLSLALMTREDRKMLVVRHAQGPFAGRWSPPFIGVGPVEVAEDAIERLLRDYLHVQPGSCEFLDTVYVTGANGERFIANGFICEGWSGTAKVPPQIFQEAVWVTAAELATLDVPLELRNWLPRVLSEGDPVPPRYEASAILQSLADARGDLLAAFDEVPSALRDEPLEEGGWRPLDVLAHASDVEAYYRSETRRCMEQGGRAFRPFNDAQWYDNHLLRPSEDEAALRARLEEVREETRAWVGSLSPTEFAAYFDHPTLGVTQAGDRLGRIASHDRSHAGQLREMKQAALVQAAASRGGAAESREDRP